MSTNRSADPRGFSVLEMVVALAVLAAVMIPLLTLQNQLLDNVLRYDRAFDRMTMTRNAAAILADLNPMSQPTGRLPLDDGLTLTWTAEALSSEHPNVSPDNAEGRFIVALYEINVVVIDDRGERVTGYRVERLGWRRKSGGRLGPDPIAPLVP